MKKHQYFVAALAMFLAMGFVSCDDGTNAGTSSRPYTIIYHVGEGSGVPPVQSPVVAGTVIRLPDQETMQGPPGREELSGWYSGTGSAYPPLANYTVTGNVEFTAQWRAPTSNPGGNNPGNNNPGGTGDPGNNNPSGTNPGGSTGQGNSFLEQLNRIIMNVQSHGSYTIELSADENIAPLTLSFGDLINVTITLKGSGTNRTLRLSANGSMFTVRPNLTLVLGENITLQGHSQNNDSLVKVEGGTLVMNDSSAIIGNTATYNGGGVYVGSGNVNGRYASGTFTMNGGIISNNIARIGGGVCIDSGTFAKTGGTITGYASDPVNGNRAINDSSHAVHAHVVGAGGAKSKSTTAGPGTNLFYYPTSGGWDN